MVKKFTVFLVIVLIVLLMFSTVAVADTEVVHNTYQDGDFSYILDNP